VKSYEATFGFWSELKVTPEDGPHIQTSGDVAWADGITPAAGKPETGDPIAGAPTFEMMVLEKRGDRWFLVSRSVWRVSQ
jgi:ketosteroid isomerase-like protein